MEKEHAIPFFIGDLGDVQGSASRRRRSCCRAGERPSSTIPHDDNDANQREAHGCAYCKVALQHSAFPLFLGCRLTQSTFCPRKRFDEYEHSGVCLGYRFTNNTLHPGKRSDEYEHSGVCLGSKRRRVGLWVTGRLQKLKQLSGRARFMRCLPHQTVKMHAQKENHSKMQRRGSDTSSAASSSISKHSAAPQGGSGCIKSPKKLLTTMSTMPSGPRRRTVRLPPCAASTALSSSQSSPSASLVHTCTRASTRKQSVPTRQRTHLQLMARQRGHLRLELHVRQQLQSGAFDAHHELLFR